MKLMELGKRLVLSEDNPSKPIRLNNPEDLEETFNMLIDNIDRYNGTADGQENIDTSKLEVYLNGKK